MGKVNNDVVQKVEVILRRHNIEKPYCHGGKYNSTAMVTFMTNSSLIMDDLQEMLLSLPQHGRCANEEVQEVTSKYKNILHVFDGLFCLARTPSGLVTEEHIAKLQRFVVEGMKLWREMELSTEAPKPHAIEYHWIDQMIQFNGIGNLGEDFVEQSHQDG